MERRGVLAALVVGLILFTTLGILSARAASIDFNPDQGISTVTMDQPVANGNANQVEQPVPAPVQETAKQADKPEDQKGIGDKLKENIVDPIKKLFDDAVEAIKKGLGLEKSVKVPKESLNGYPNLKHLADSGKDYELVQNDDGKFYLKDEDGNEILFDGVGAHEGEKEKSSPITIDKEKKESPCGEGICIIHPQQNDTVPASSTIVLQVLTANKSYCRYSQIENASYDDWNQFNKDSRDIAHTKRIGKLLPGDYIFYYSCKDENENLFNATHYFTVGQDREDNEKNETETPEENETIIGGENETEGILIPLPELNNSLNNYTAEINGTDNTFNLTVNFSDDPETGDKKFEIIIDVPAPENVTENGSASGNNPVIPSTNESSQTVVSSPSSGSSGGGGGGSSGGSSSRVGQKNVTITIQKDGEVLAAIPLTVDVQPSLTGNVNAPIPAIGLGVNPRWWTIPLILLAILSILPIMLLLKNKREDTLVKQLKALIERSYAALQKGNLVVAMNNYKVLKGYLEMYREKIPRADYNRLMSDSSQLYGYISSKTRMSPMI